MRIERFMLLLVWVLLGAGAVVWLTGGGHHLRDLGAWLLLGALAVLCLPLVAWIIHFLLKRKGSA